MPREPTAIEERRAEKPPTLEEFRRRASEPRRVVEPVTPRASLAESATMSVEEFRRRASEPTIVEPITEPGGAANPTKGRGDAYAQQLERNILQHLSTPPGERAARAGLELAGGLAGAVGGAATRFPGGTVLGEVGGLHAGRVAGDVLFDENATLVPDLPTMATDFGLSIASLGAAGLLKRTIAPLGPQNASRAELRAAANRTAERLRALAPEGSPMAKLKGRHLLSTGELSGNVSLLRAESFYSKIPGSAGRLQKLAAKEERAIQWLQNNIGAEFGELAESRALGVEAAQRLTQHYERYLRVRNIYENRAEQAANLKLREMARGEPSVLPPRAVSVRAASEFAASGAVARRETFRATDERLFANFYETKLPDGTTMDDQRVVQLDEMLKRVEQLEQQAVKGEPMVFELPHQKRTLVHRPVAKVAFSPEVRRKLVEFRNAARGPITVRQAKAWRNTLYDSLNRPDIMPGMTDGQIKYLAGALDAELGRVPAQLRKQGYNEAADALELANAYHAQHHDRFLERGVSELFMSPQDFGFQPRQLYFSKYVNSGELDTVERIRSFFGADSPEWKSLVGSHFNEMLDRSTSVMSGGRLVAADKLIGTWDGMTPAMKRALYGDKVPEVDKQMRALAARFKLIDVDQLRGMSGDEAAISLQRAALVEERAALEFENKVVKPFLQDKLGRSAIDPERFVRHMMRTGSADDVEKVFAKLSGSSKPADWDSDPLIGRIRRRMMVTMLEASERAPAPNEMMDLLLGFEGSGVAADPRRLLKIMHTWWGGDKITSLGKMRRLLGKDAMDNMQDILLIRTSKLQKSSEATTAGQLAAGTYMRRLADFKDWVPTVLKVFKYRVLATVLSTPGTRTWLSVPWGPAGPKLKGAAATAGPLVHALMEEFEHEPDLLDIALQAGGTSLAEVRGGPSIREGLVEVPEGR